MTSDVSKHRAVRQHHATSRPGSTRSRPRCGECASRRTLSKLGSRPLEGNAAGLASLHDSQIGGPRGGAPSCTPWLAELACGIWMLRILWKGRRVFFNCLSSLAVLPDKIGSNEHKAVRFCSLWQESTEIQLSRFGKCKENNQAVKGAPI